MGENRLGHGRSARAITRGAALAAAIAAAIATLGAIEAAHAEPRPAAPAASAPVMELQNLMTRTEYRAAGLDRLSPKEMAFLNGWMGRLVVRLLSNKKQEGCASAIESRIDGEFEGWSGDTVFELENGQVWKQRGDASRSSYKVSPVVRIHREGAGCKLKVVGLKDEIAVERLK
jgi:hypothetical protein